MRNCFPIWLHHPLYSNSAKVGERWIPNPIMFWDYVEVWQENCPAIAERLLRGGRFKMTCLASAPYVELDDGSIGEIWSKHVSQSTRFK